LSTGSHITMVLNGKTIVDLHNGLLTEGPVTLQQ
jgi:hypothetical protein